jgi:hypothetical protein
MPIDVRFSINEDLRREYELRADGPSSTVRVTVPGELDLTFARELFESSGLPNSALRSSNASRFALRLSRLFTDKDVPTRVSTS